MKNWKIFFFVTIGIATLLIGSNTTFAGENTRAEISIDFDYNHMGDNGQTLVTGVGASQDVNFEIHCNNASNFAAFTVKIAFDTTMLIYKAFSLDNVTTGESCFLKSAGGSVLTFPEPTVSDGVLELNAVILPADTANSPEGSGLLGVVTFTTADCAIADVHLVLSSVKYYDAAAERDEINLLHTNIIGGTINPSDVATPTPITDLTADLTVEDNLQLTWSNPGANDVAIFKYSTSPITQRNWDEATTLIHTDFVSPSQTPTPSLEFGVLKSEFADTSYYFAMKTMDLTPNVSYVSNNARLGFFYYSVSGVVGLADNPTDSSGSTVTLNGMTDTTDVHGMYYISPVEPDTYTITASREGYSTADTVVNVTQSMVINFEISPTFQDVAPVAIESPLDTAFCDSIYAVRAKVANVGYLPSTFDVYCFVGYLDGITVYADTIYDQSLAPGESLSVEFEKDWHVPSTDSITYRVYVITYFEEDDNPDNNTLWKDVFTYCLPYPDVGPISMESPPDAVIINQIYPVNVVVRNFGNVSSTFSISCITDGYGDMVEVAGLAPGESTTVKFKDWKTPSTTGDLTMNVVSHLMGDVDRTNDTLRKTIAVLAAPAVLINEIYYDEADGDKHTFTEIKGMPGVSLDGTHLLGISGSHGAVYASIALTGNVPSDGYFVVGQGADVDNVDMVSSAVNWRNGPNNVWLIYVSEGDTIALDKVGYGDFETPPDTFFLGEGLSAAGVDPGHSIARYPDGQDTDNNNADFKDFPAPTPGFPNEWSDVAVDNILSPSVSVGCGDTIKPSAIVKNEGEKEETFEVICTVKTANGDTLKYTDEKEITLGVGADKTVEFKEWNVPGCWKIVNYVVTVYAYLPLDQDTTDNRKVRTIESVGVNELVELPSAFMLLQNNPNPLVTTTNIAYQLPNKCNVNLAVYNATGRLVRTLVDKFEDAGHKLAIWNGKDDKGNDVASGIYFYKLEAGDYVAQKKMILIR